MTAKELGRAVALAILVATLAACGRAPSGATGPLIAAADAPHVKPGMWRMTIETAGAPTQSRDFCDAGRSLAPGATAHCEKQEFRRTASGGFTDDTRCSGVELRDDYEGDFTSHFTDDTTMTLDATNATSPVTHRHIDLQYLGPCPAGQAPVR